MGVLPKAHVLSDLQLQHGTDFRQQSDVLGEFIN